MAAVSVLTLGLFALCCMTSVQKAGGQEVIQQCLTLDCPGFTLVATTKDYELRRYAPSKWTQTVYTEESFSGINPGSAAWLAKRNESKMAFMRLLNYIKGNNSQGVEIPLTVPVLRKVVPGPGGSKTVTMYFMVPFQFQSDTPTPTDSLVSLQSMPQQDVYLRVFGGFATEAQWTEELSALKTALADPALYHGDFYVTAGYDAPWKETGRRNEIWLIKA